MKFTVASLTDAIAQHIGRDLAGRIGPALKTIRAGTKCAGDAVTHNQVGALLAEAVRPGSGASIVEAELVSVQILIGGMSGTLAADDAEGHPLLCGWLPANLAEAFAFPLLNAASMAAFAADRPGTVSVEVVARGDVGLRGAAIFELAAPAGLCRVIAHYGAANIPDPAHVTMDRLDGHSLAAVGFGLVPGARPISPSAEGLPVADHAAQPADVTRH